MKKLKNKKGFTLVEMLACCITLLLITGVCTLGTHVALDSYNRSLFVSESQMLESTLDLYLGDILRHATIKSDGIVKESGNYGVETISNLSYGMVDGKLELQKDTSKAHYGRLLVYKKPTETEGTMFMSENVYTSTLYIYDFKLEYNPDGRYVTGSYIIKSTVVEDAAYECEFTYRLVTMY